MKSIQRDDRIRLSARQRAGLAEVVVSVPITETLIETLEIALSNYAHNHEILQRADRLRRTEWRWFRATRELLREMEALDGIILIHPARKQRLLDALQIVPSTCTKPPMNRRDEAAALLGVSAAAALIAAGVDDSLGHRFPTRRSEFIEALTLVREWGDVRVGRKPIRRRDIFTFAQKARADLRSLVAMIWPDPRTT